MNEILVRDLAQEGRKVKTFILRVAAIFCVLTLVWVGNFDMDGSPRYDGSAVGLLVFMRLALGLVAALMLTGFSVTLPGLKAEMDSGVMEVLLCSRLSPARIVISKIFAGGIVPLSIVLACTPIMAMATFYGGVSPLQAMAVFVMLVSLSMLCSAVGASVALNPIKGKSPFARIVKWLVVYNALTLLIAVNPFVSVVSCALNGGFIRIGIVSVLNVVLTMRAVSRSVRILGQARRTSSFPVWLDSGRTPAARGVFAGVGRQHPMIWKELQEGGHSAFYTIGTFIVCMILTCDLFALVMAEMRLSSLALYLKTMFSVHLVAGLIFCVMILSQAISSEREQGTLPLLLLSRRSVRQFIRDKIAAIKTSIKPMAYSAAAHAAAAIAAGIIGSGFSLMIGWLAGLFAIVGLCLLYCAVALFISAIAPTGARALQGGMAVVVAGLILPLMLPSSFLSTTGLSYISLSKQIAQWPYDVHAPYAVLAGVLSLLCASLLLRQAEKRTEASFS